MARVEEGFARLDSERLREYPTGAIIGMYPGNTVFP